MNLSDLPLTLQAVSDSALIAQLRVANCHLLMAAMSARELQAGAEQALVNQDHFLASLAHELRNPLTPINLAINAMGSQGGSGANFPRLQLMLSRQMSHLTHLVSELDDLTRIKSGKLLMDMQLVSPAEAAMVAIEMVQPNADAHFQKLAVRFPGTRLLVHGDFDRLVEVFANLLSNAIKFTPEYGNIALEIEQHNPWVTIAVKDDGAGISEAFRPMMFDLFRQEGRPPLHSSAGSGIGLSLVQALVALHGGTIAMESGLLQHGSTFIVTLPLASAC
jgi:signal transduction histidine kinase